MGVDVKRDVEVPDHKLRVVRSKRYGNWRDWFTPEDVDLYRPRLRAILERFGYPDEWELNDKPAIDHREGAGYVEALVYGRLPEQT